MKQDNNLHKAILIVSGALIIIFGVATVFMSGSVIFDLFGIRQQEGNYVLFIVIANFICGIIYLIAGYGFITRKRWVLFLLAASMLILILSLIGLIIYINSGGIYEDKTLKAMGFRIVVTGVFLLISRYYLKKHILS